MGDAAFSCSRGSTFLLSGHLWVVISDPFGSPQQVILAYLTSRKASSDTTVVLSPQDHDFIKHPTVISYADARIERTDFVMKRVEERDYEPRRSFRDDVVRTIQQGLLDSPFTPRYLKTAFLNQDK